MRKPTNLSPLCDGFRFAVYNNQMVAPHIPLLLLSRRPPNIRRFIVPIIINSIELMILRRPHPNIIKKFLKRGSPPLTHSNPATTPSKIIWPIFVVAPILHARPNVILWRLLSVNTRAMTWIPTHSSSRNLIPTFPNSLTTSFHDSAKKATAPPSFAS